MQNMRKLLSAFGALSFVTVAGISTVACNSCNKDKGIPSLNNEVLKDLGLLEKSKIELKLEVTDSGEANWNVESLKGITALNLLNAESKAKSKVSFDLLTEVLKLETKGDGDYKTKTFDEAKARAVFLTIDSIEPDIKPSPSSDDFVVAGGSAKIQWKQGDTKLGDQYAINLKVSEEDGIIASVLLPLANEVGLDTFNTKAGILKNFIDKGKVSSIRKNTDITALLRTDSGAGKKFKAISDKIDQALKITIITIHAQAKDKDGNFMPGDSLDIEVSLGSVKFTNLGFKLELSA